MKNGNAFGRNGWARPVLVGLIGFPVALCAAEPGLFTGSLSGVVRDPAGVPQMGATILLFNRYDRPLAKTVSSEGGLFLFDALVPDVYSIRVTLTNFVPAFRRNIAVQPGMKSVLAINLNSLLSSIELVYMAPGQAAVMSDQWKWVLRSASATRPVLRIMPGVTQTAPGSAKAASALFSNTEGLIRLSAGEGGMYSSLGNQTDLGTAFAVATSLFGVNQLRVAGNLGYASNPGIPTAAFQTSFSRNMETGLAPEVNVTMRQIFLPSRFGAGFLSGAQGSLPAMQSLAVTGIDRRVIADNLFLEYGSTLESVSFLHRLNYLSPFARLRVGRNQAEMLQVAFSSGTVPTELLFSGEAPGGELQHQLSVLGLFPRVSLFDSSARVQRSTTYEVGYERRVGEWGVGVWAWRDSVSNAVFTMAAPAGFYTTADLLPDLSSSSAVFNVGDYSRMGYASSVSRKIFDEVTASLAYGFIGGLAPLQADLLSNNPAELRSNLRTSMGHTVTARLSGTAPVFGTRYTAGYMVARGGWLMPAHYSLTGRNGLEPGLNLYLRQPIPRFSGVLPGRLEASADLRNLLAQGYLPMMTPNGRRVILLQAPRSVRGGLSFIF